MTPPYRLQVFVEPGPGIALVVDDLLALTGPCRALPDRRLRQGRSQRPGLISAVRVRSPVTACAASS